MKERNGITIPYLFFYFLRLHLQRLLIFSFGYFSDFSQLHIGIFFKDLYLDYINVGTLKSKFIEKHSKSVYILFVICMSPQGYGKQDFPKLVILNFLLIYVHMNENN